MMPPTRHARRDMARRGMARSMTRGMTPTTVLLLPLLLAACGSGPSHFFTLSPEGPAAPLPVAACATPPIAVQRVLLPGVLDRQSVVRQRSPGVVEISGNDEWGAPLGEMIRHVMAQDLRLDLGSTQVLLPGDAAPAGGTIRLTLNIASFEADTAGRVTLQADWALVGTGGAVLAERTETITTQAAGTKTEPVVAAMSQALGELARRIAAVRPGCGAGFSQQRPPV